MHAFENVVCEMAVILSRPQCDNLAGAYNIDIDEGATLSTKPFKSWI